jgi:hypothetical protein
MQTEQTSESIMLAAIKALGDISSEELRDVMIALRLPDDIGDEAIRFGLSISAIEVVEGFNHHVLRFCQIIEEQMSN